MDGRPGIVLYFADVTALDALGDAEFGKLIRALCAHARGEEIRFDEPAMKIAFALLCDKTDRDSARYNRIRDKRAEAGKKSAEKRKEAEHMLTLVNTCRHMEVNGYEPGDKNEPGKGDEYAPPDPRIQAFEWLKQRMEGEK